MIEQKLKDAAARMPEPKYSLPATPEPQHRRPRYALIAAVLAAVLLVGCVAGSLDITLWNGGEVKDWDWTERTALDHGLQLPETLLDAPFLDCRTYKLTEQMEAYLLAMLFPEYTYYGVAYGTEVIRQEIHKDEYGIGRTQWTERTEVITVTFGSDDNEYWRRQFGFDENGVYSKESRADRLLASETTTLDGLTMYLATYASTQGQPFQRLSWHDPARSLVVQLDLQGESWEPLLEAAEAILALNP